MMIIAYSYFVIFPITAWCGVSASKYDIFVIKVNIKKVVYKNSRKPKTVHFKIIFVYTAFYVLSGEPILLN